MARRIINAPPPYARIAGLLYLVIIISGLFGEVFVRSSLVLVDDAAATAANIVGSESLFRLGFFADAIMVSSDVAIAALFYVLFKPVNTTLSLIAAAFRLTQAAILGLNLLYYYAALLVLTGVGYASVFDVDQLHALMMLLIDMHSHGYDLGLIFFGLSNLILGYLIIRSDHVSGIFGYGLVAAALVYLAGSFMRFLVPDYLSLVKPFYGIPLVAELLFCLRLLAGGLKT